MTPAPAAKAVPVPRPTTRSSNAFKDNVGGGPSDVKSTPGNAVEAGEVDTRLVRASVAGGAATSREEQVLPPDIHADKEAPATTELTLAFDKSGRYAYVVALWGSAAGFALGALVLGAALRRSGTRYDLVLLYTEDVPASTIDLLSTVWITREVRYLEGHENLYTCKGYRFDGVFTKLHVLSLVEYEKVLMLDIDLAIIACPDERLTSGPLRRCVAAKQQPRPAPRVRRGRVVRRCPQRPRVAAPGTPVRTIGRTPPCRTT